MLFDGHAAYEHHYHTQCVYRNAQYPRLNYTIVLCGVVFVMCHAR